MTLVLLLSLLIVCVIWLNRTLDGNRAILAVMAVFIVCSLASTILPLLFVNDYLDGIQSLISLLLVTFIFWIASIISLVRNGLKTKNFKFSEVLIVCTLLIIPIIVLAIFIDADLRIGG